LAWTIEYDPRALKDIKKLGRSVQSEIYRYITTRIASAADPRALGKPLTGSKFGLWRCRSGDYRIICELQDHKLVVLVVAMDHRKNIYE